MNTAIFSVLNGALWHWLAAQRAHELVMLTDPNASMVLGGMLQGERSLLTFPEFTKLRDGMRSVSGVCASEMRLERWPVRIAGSSQEQVSGRLVSENYFGVFAVQPALGRFFTQRDAVGEGKDPYAVISYSYWQRRFGGSPTVLGTSITLRRTTMVIIGVARKKFRGESVGQEPDLWLPMLMEPLVNPGNEGLKDMMDTSQVKFMWLHAFARRRAGVSITQVQAETNVLFRRILETDYPVSMQPEARKEALNQKIVAKPLGSGAFHGRKEFAEQWLLLLGLAGLVLFVACANVANLLLAKAAARTQEVAIRLAIGAARTRLMWQFLTESLLLAILGGVTGLMIAEGLVRALLLMLSDANEEFSIPAGLDLRVLGFSAGVTLMAGVLFGLAPALRASGSKMHERIKNSGRGANGSLERATFARTLVMAQVALSLLLVIGAGLFLRTLWNLEAVDLGYRPNNMLLMRVDSWNAGYQGKRTRILYGELQRRLREIPGVSAVSYSARGIFSEFDGSFPIFDVDGFASKKEADRGSTGDSVGTEYFSTIGIPILLGREFNLHDMPGPPQVCIINEAFAKNFFGSGNPIGRHFSSVLSDEDGTEGSRRLEVVGVSRDARVYSMRGPIDPKFYLPGGESWFEVRTKGDPNTVLPAARRTVLAVDPALSIERMTTLAEAIQRENAQPRLVARLATGFGILALVLAAVGVYSLLSYGVARRTNEIGIRVALGADRSTITSMILKEMGWMMMAGLLAGVATALGAARLLSSQLYGLDDAGPRWSLARYEQVDSATQLFGLKAMDPLTIGAAVAILCGLGLIAAYLPAARAARVDPVQALRGE